MQANVPIQAYASEGGQALQMIAFSKTVRTIAIGSIVGGGMFGLAKMWRTFANIFKTLVQPKGEGSQEYMEGRAGRMATHAHSNFHGSDLPVHDPHLLGWWLPNRCCHHLCNGSHHDDLPSRSHRSACHG